MAVANDHVIHVGAERSLWTGSGARPRFGRQVPATWVPHRDRLFAVMKARDLDGLVVQLRQNVFYLAGYSSPNTEIRHETETAAVVLISRHEPDHPVLVMDAVDISHMATHPSWIGDIRAYFTHLLPPDVARDERAFDRFAAPIVKDTAWGPAARRSVTDSVFAACRSAAADIGLDRGRVGFDNLTFANALALPGAEIVDAYSTLKYIRQVKTPQEIERLRAGAALNQIAVGNTVASYGPGMTWFEVNHVYDLNCVALGGWVQYGGGIALSNADADPDAPVFHPQYQVEDHVIEPGSSIMLDCHGQLDHYRWDGGKTWLVDDAERRGTPALVQRACEEAATLILDGLRPGVGVHELMSAGRAVFRMLGVPGADYALVFFHGMGLDHTDIEIRSSSTTANWTLEENMVLATHVAYPGERGIRYYLEDVAVVTPTGGVSLYTWDLKPHHKHT